MISPIERFALLPAILIVVVSSIPVLSQTPSSQIKPSATETRKSATLHVSGTAAKARRHSNVRASGAAPKNEREPEHTGTYYNCLEIPQPEGCD
jgi:hypothetical protein